MSLDYRCYETCYDDVQEYKAPIEDKEFKKEKKEKKEKEDNGGKEGKESSMVKGYRALELLFGKHPISDLYLLGTEERYNKI